MYYTLIMKLASMLHAATSELEGEGFMSGTFFFFHVFFYSKKMYIYLFLTLAYKLVNNMANEY